MYTTVAAEYFKNTTLLLVGVICVAAAVEKWNLHKRIALRMVLMAGAKPGMLLLCFMCCTTLLSMWLSNTSTTAMVMPIVEAVLQELVSADEEQLMAGNSSTEEAEPISTVCRSPSPLCSSTFLLQCCPARRLPPAPLNPVRTTTTPSFCCFLSSSLYPAPALATCSFSVTPIPSAPSLPCLQQPPLRRSPKMLQDYKTLGLSMSVTPPCLRSRGKGEGLDVNTQPSLELIFVNEETKTNQNPAFSARCKSLMLVHVECRPQFSDAKQVWSLSQQNLNGVPTTTNPVKTANHQGKKQHPSQEPSLAWAPSQYPAAEVVNFGTWFLFSLPISLIMLVVSWFWMHWLFLGCK
ncbi:Solute carrier family 13 member 4 [Camelus dromedarius]|uniref:Solute carrier family 13 member 4 n=1 Tax=Camelus dromedarius TaxID=9838 RepID=A0A5N4DYU0_CAMDR|nr:Solute carrier family 13 member 4 [Camelus dromedarius]